MGLRFNEKTPLEGIIWYPRTNLITNPFLHYILTLLLHLLPALLIDGILKLSGRRPMLVKIYRKVYTGVVTLSYFLLNDWAFHNTKIINILMMEVPPAEREIFGFDYGKVDTEKYFHNCLIGAKLYLLHEDLTRIESVKRHYERMRWIDRIFNVCMIGLLVWILWKAGIVSAVIGYFSPFGNESLFNN